MQAVAFYLPQYHVIPENEIIYGKNFTEWDNVRNARPLFKGHMQPHLPHPTFGFYNLLDEKFLTFQHELAYENEVRGFCYYYYNLAGKRMLEKPLDIINKSKSIKNSFCLCWDYKDWYNNRMGAKEIFIEQQYSRHFARQLFGDVMQYFANDRYITIDGRPLFLVFAPERHPSMAEYVDIWREEALRAGLPGIFLAGVEAFAGGHPVVRHFDCMVEFAPNWVGESQVSPPGEKPRRMDYGAVLRYMFQKEVPDYHRLRCVFPGWDNTPRRGENGLCHINASPELYGLALESMARYTSMALPSSLQYIFINAWNEWGEGAYLEPDMRNGFRYLKLTRDIMKQFAA